MVTQWNTEEKSSATSKRSVCVPNADVSQMLASEAGGGNHLRLIRCGFHRSRINCWMIWCSLSVSSTDMVLKFLMGVDTYTGNLRYGIDMCMGMRFKKEYDQ